MCICVLKLTFLLIPVLGKPFFLIIFTGRKKSRKDIRFSSWCCFPYMLWKTKQRSKDNQVHIWASGILKPGSWVARSFLTRSLVAKKPPSVSSEDLGSLDRVDLSGTGCVLQSCRGYAYSSGLSLAIRAPRVSCCHLSTPTWDCDCRQNGEIFVGFS